MTLFDIFTNSLFIIRAPRLLFFARPSTRVLASLTLKGYDLYQTQGYLTWSDIIVSTPGNTTSTTYLYVFLLFAFIRTNTHTN